ncbi:MAG: tyrosine-type recombinase/integrase [Planctomycetes bacterium]|nr:tyrosine-type recombinase/integrase [Planctomycetota bacterium]
MKWLKDTSNELRLVKLAIELGVDEPPAPPVVPVGLLLSEVVELYLEDYAVNRLPGLVKRQRERLKAFIDYARNAELYRLPGPQFRPVRITEFRDHLSRLNKVVSKGKKKVRTRELLSGGAKNSYLRTTRAFLSWARMRDHMQLSRDDIADRLPSFRTERKLPKALDASQLVALMKAAIELDGQLNHGSRKDKSAYYTGKPSASASSTYEPLAPMLLTLILTGMRRGEVLHLKWSDVDLDAKRIFVRNDDAQKHKVKTRRERCIPLDDSPALLQLLSAMAVRRGRSKYVIAGRTPSQPKNFKYQAWERMTKKAKCTGVSPKDLRSTFSTCAAAAIRGPQPLYLAARMGHALEVAHRHYVALGVRRDGDLVEQWLGVEQEVWLALEELGFAPGGSSRRWAQ